MTASVAAKVTKARDHVLKSERLAAVKLFKEAHREASKDSLREVDQAWREAVEVFLTDRGQSQFSMAESVWLSRPKEALDILSPIQKTEFENLAVTRLAARAALRLLDCALADTFVKVAESTFPPGLDVKVLRLQVKACLVSSDPAAAELILPTLSSQDPETIELEPAVRALAVKEALRRGDTKAFKQALQAWEARTVLRPFEDPQYWYLKWRHSMDSKSTTAGAVLRDRNAARNYLRLCAEMSPRRRKNFAIHPEHCLHTESVESDLKSSDKAES